ncbi:MAG: class I SAM-dependent methyltransferase [Candidatus Heimdallarchaeota archaeon]|nr:class I SAM-dependent methyltransferase [Candidatus Heimdallarchaeota archaeon]
MTKTPPLTSQHSSSQKNGDFSLKAHLYSFFTGFLYLFGGARESRFRKKVLQQFLPSTGEEKVLDICCANGKQTQTLASLFPRGTVVGVDIDPKMIFYAKKHFQNFSNLKFVCGDVSRLPFSDNSFDIVTSFLALHEIPTTLLFRVLHEVKRVLKTTGYFLVFDFQLPPKSFSSLNLRYYALRLFEDESAAFFMMLDHKQLFKKFGFKLHAAQTYFKGLLFCLLLQPEK